MSLRSLCRSRRLWFGVFAFCVVAACVVAVLLFMFVETPLAVQKLLSSSEHVSDALAGRDAFERQAWQASPDDRLPMARDVCHRGLLDGCTREQVEELLGPAVDPDAEVFREPNEVLWYAGMDIIDPSFIHVRFGADGRVLEYYLSQH